jgi:hypothetical protein
MKKREKFSNIYYICLSFSIKKKEVFISFFFHRDFVPPISLAANYPDLILYFNFYSIEN